MIDYSRVARSSRASFRHHFPLRAHSLLALSGLLLTLAGLLLVVLLLPVQAASRVPGPAVQPAKQDAGRQGPRKAADLPRKADDPLGDQPCPAPCTNSARASKVSPAEVVKGELTLDCASVHFGGFIPGYGGFELFGLGHRSCPAVETYIPSHYGATPAFCRDCEWRDGATIRERENACSEEVNFIFFAMPNCVRGEWVNTSERVRTCSGDSTCHRKIEGGSGPGRRRP